MGAAKCGKKLWLKNQPKSKNPGIQPSHGYFIFSVISDSYNMNHTLWFVMVTGLHCFYMILVSTKYRMRSWLKVFDPKTDIIRSLDSKYIHSFRWNYTIIRPKIHDRTQSEIIQEDHPWQLRLRLKIYGI